MKLISLTAAAKILGTHRTQVERFVGTGRLKAVKLNKQYRTSEQWISELQPDAIQNDSKYLELDHGYFR